MEISGMIERQVALVTGVSSGIGQAKFLDRGLRKGVRTGK